MKCFRNPVLLCLACILSGCCSIKTDVLVVGGGTAGVPAAIEAARGGCDVTPAEVPFDELCDCLSSDGAIVPYK